MKSSMLSCLFTVCILSAPIVLWGQETTAKAGLESGESIEGGKNTVNTLAIGTPASEVEKRLGKPALIEKIDTKQGPAEVWVYRRLKKSKRTIKQDGVKNLTTHSLTTDNQVVSTVHAGGIPIERPVVTETWEVAQVIMFQDKFAGIRHFLGEVEVEK